MFGGFLKKHYLCTRKRENESNWRVGRVIDRAGLEIRYTPFGYRGFESLTLRKEKNKVSNYLETLFLFMLNPQEEHSSVAQVLCTTDQDTMYPWLRSGYR